MAKEGQHSDAVKLPKGYGNEMVQLPPAAFALEETVDSSISTATALNFNASTEYFEIIVPPATGALNVYVKYETVASATNVTTSNFDEVVLAGQSRSYVRPAGTTGISFIDSGNSETIIIIEK